MLAQGLSGSVSSNTGEPAVGQPQARRAAGRQFFRAAGPMRSERYLLFGTVAISHMCSVRIARGSRAIRTKALLSA
jgi:hypothetical protein